MITWDDVKRLPRGAILYEEIHRDKLIIFLARIVVRVDDDEVTLLTEEGELAIYQSQFPHERLFLNE